MSNAGLVLILALAAEPSGHHAEATVLPGARLHQRAAERGPVRIRLEAALAATASDLAVQAVDAARTEAAAAPSTSTPSPHVPALVWLLVGLASVFVLLYEWGRAWSKI
jgi:hypothetical protein